MGMISRAFFVTILSVGPNTVYSMYIKVHVLCLPSTSAHGLAVASSSGKATAGGLQRQRCAGWGSQSVKALWTGTVFAQGHCSMFTEAERKAFSLHFQ